MSLESARTPHRGSTSAIPFTRHPRCSYGCSSISHEIIRAHRSRSDHRRRSRIRCLDAGERERRSAFIEELDPRASGPPLRLHRSVPKVRGTRSIASRSSRGSRPKNFETFFGQGSDSSVDLLGTSGSYLLTRPKTLLMRNPRHAFQRSPEGSARIRSPETTRPHKGIPGDLRAGRCRACPGVAHTPDPANGNVKPGPSGTFVPRSAGRSRARSFPSTSSAP